MVRRFLPALFVVAAAPAALAAQTPITPPGVGLPDQLAAQMRLLATSPNDLGALLTAGELSVRLEDLGAAASFFARAEKIDPHNGRAKAGEAAILVHAERPGEALRYFALAESYGAPVASFASDRGLAYDLIGEQERAQRDYRLALRTAPGAANGEETRRRYALSLAIAGKRELADQELQPLLRQSDRGAWRARAFVLAMAGNVAEAERIATTMMPPGTAAGLQPFLQKLPTLGPVDRAFAVHFGEVRSTPERVADARKVPALPALGADPYAPRVEVAAVAPDRRKRPESKRHDKRAPVQVAVATPAPEPLPQVPNYRPAAGSAPILASSGAAPTAWPTAVTPASQPMRAVARPAPSSPYPPLPLPTAVAPAVTRPVEIARAEPVAPRPAQVQTRTAAPPETNVTVAAASTMPTAVAPPAATVAAPPAAASTPTPASVSSSPVTQPSASTTSIAGAVPAAWPTAITPETPRPTVDSPPPAAPPPAARPVRDTALAGIVASLPIPASELGVGPVVSAPPAAAAQPDPAAERAAAAKALADKRAADRKVAAEKKALGEKKAAAAKKAEEEREAAAQKKLERANPERIWVQVAGGANAHDLPKAWAAVKAKGGDLFAGHATGWTTPLRFTNRVLTGPFKTDEEARAFVNKAKAAGLPAFSFTSEAGQVVTKLSTK